MADNVSYTTDEIAKLLKISKLTVYDLIKKGELLAYRVGKQMRVDASDLEAYKNRSKGLANVPAHMQSQRQHPHTAAHPQLHTQAQPQGGTTAASGTLPVSGSLGGLAAPSAAWSGAAEAYPHPAAEEPASGIARPIVITGQDASLDLLARHIESRTAAFRPLRSFTGSLDSLISMYKGQSDIVSTHLLDGDTGEYNVPFTRKLLVGMPHVVIHMLRRKAGLYVKRGNPFGIRAWSDLARPDIRFVNRERGSGTRVLLDEQLRLLGISPQQIRGYEDEQMNHVGVAAKVASGEADAGAGSEKAAAMVGDVDFIPLAVESYDLVLLRKPDNRLLIETVTGILRSEQFREELQAMSGYDLTGTGGIVYES
ncbi:substrate-binding domain-containing protein [Paenibacillus protaetiae]|uniref:Helix-turn-helix domain-containing protein n=1 Tax=Paenibacillus protaetiae TaxID=2509456 RepID=A0A4P6EX78_9BACL|nr:helix-turn-helix transcriptional regulator [Paenibacillus protaetiae]QAY67255.1 helix-turn-helix domain-containing protein [Paenibacillus protaetiae]